jgi:hypothetical protein
VRLLGSITAKARRAAGYRWFNSLPAGQAIDCLANAGIPAALATEIAGQRPLQQDHLIVPEAGAGDGNADVYRRLAAMVEGDSPARLD